MGGPWQRQQALTAGQQEIQPQRETLRAVNQVIQHGLRQRRRDNPLMFNAGAGQAQRGALFQTVDLYHHRGAELGGNLTAVR
ncbi:hypothetical protein D3C81_1300410 [compost metagenome]